MDVIIVLAVAVAAIGGVGTQVTKAPVSDEAEYWSSSRTRTRSVDSAAPLVVVAAAIGATIAFALAIHLLNAFGCAHRWEASGRDTRFDWFAGCLVETSEGVFVPERAVRAMP